MDRLRPTRFRMTVTLFLAQVLFSATMIAIFTVAPIMASDLSGQVSAAGFPSTVGLLGRALSAYPIGWLMDRTGRRMSLSLAYGVGAFGIALAVWAILSGDFVWFLIGVGLFGMGRGGSELGRYVAAEIQAPEQRAKAIGWIVSAGAIGAFAGRSLMEPSRSLVKDLRMLPETGPFVLGSALMIAAMVLIWTFLRPDPASIADAEKTIQVRRASHDRSIWQFLRSSQVLMALAAMSVGQVVMMLVMVITPLHMDHLGQGIREIEWVMTAHTAGMFGLAWLTGTLVDRYGRVVMIFVGAVLLVFATVLTPLASTALSLAVALFLLGLGWNFCFVAGSSLLTDAVGVGDKGRLQGAGEVVVALSSGAGSLGTGFLFAAGGIQIVGGISLGFVLALLAGATWFSWARRRTSIEPA